MSLLASRRRSGEIAAPTTLHPSTEVFLLSPTPHSGTLMSQRQSQSSPSWSAQKVRTALTEPPAAAIPVTSPRKGTTLSESMSYICSWSIRRETGSRPPAPPGSLWNASGTKPLPSSRGSSRYLMRKSPSFPSAVTAQTALCTLTAKRTSARMEVCRLPVFEGVIAGGLACGVMFLSLPARKPYL